MRFFDRPSPRRIKAITIMMGALVLAWGAYLWCTSPIGTKIWIAVTGYDGCMCDDCVGGWLHNHDVILGDACGDRETIAYLALGYGAAIVLTAALTPAASWIATVGLPRKAGLCRGCGYPRAGLPPHAPCPECGGSG
jgi:hypothetical protein